MTLCFTRKRKPCGDWIALQIILLDCFWIDINECECNPCMNGGNCSETKDPGNYMCTCATGFTGRHCKKGRYFMFDPRWRTLCPILYGIKSNWPKISYISDLQYIWKCLMKMWKSFFLSKKKKKKPVVFIFYFFSILTLQKLIVLIKSSHRCITYFNIQIFKTIRTKTFNYRPWKINTNIFLIKISTKTTEK